MIEGQPSHTAERVAVERAAHQVLDSPLVLVDPLALRIIDAGHASRLQAHPEQHDASPINRITRAIVVVRSRIAEDEIARAAAAGVTQYVVLGAGLDTFAYRNPLPAVRVFEVDHADTQQRKRQRLAAGGIEVPGGVTFVSCDFDTVTPLAALRAAGFDPARPAVFAWLGVVMYLERAAAMTTLGDIVSMPPGTSVVFDYAVPPESLPFVSRQIYRRLLGRLDMAGEPWRSFFEPVTLRADLDRLGFTDVDDLGGDEINRRYLAGRDDGLQSGSVGRIVVARR
ncbi:MAG TPA: class I SAM-dependent methyltransferase [Vicinamibacterales bacterium]